MQHFFYCFNLVGNISLVFKENTEIRTLLFVVVLAARLAQWLNNLAAAPLVVSLILVRQKYVYDRYIDVYICVF